MVIALLIGWSLTGLALALLVGGAVRVADARREQQDPESDVEEMLTAA